MRRDDEQQQQDEAKDERRRRNGENESETVLDEELEKERKEVLRNKGATANSESNELSEWNHQFTKKGVKEDDTGLKSTLGEKRTFLNKSTEKDFTHNDQTETRQIEKNNAVTITNSYQTKRTSSLSLKHRMELKWIRTGCTILNVDKYHAANDSFLIAYSIPLI